MEAKILTGPSPYGSTPQDDKVPLKKITNMKAINIVLAFAGAALMACMTSCGSSRFAQDMNYVSSMDQTLVTNEGGTQDSVLYLSSVENDEVIYPELTEAEMAKAEQIEVNTDGQNVDVIIDNTGGREEVVTKSKFLAAKSVRDVEDVYEVKNAPAKTNVNAGKTSSFFRDQNDSLYFYNAETKAVHKASYVGYNVLAEKNLTGFYAGPTGGVVYYNADFNPFVGVEAGYNFARGNVRAFYSRAFQRKNGDDVNAGASFEGAYYGVDIFRTFDLTPKGKLYNAYRLEIGIGISNLDRQLEYRPELNINAPKDVNIEVDGTIYQKGGVAMPHITFNFMARFSKNLSGEVGGMFSPFTIEYRKGEARTASGGVAFGAHVSVVYFFNRWKKVRPSVTSIAKGRGVPNSVKWY